MAPSSPRDHLLALEYLDEFIATYRAAAAAEPVGYGTNKAALQAATERLEHIRRALLARRPRQAKNRAATDRDIGSPRPPRWPYGSG